MLTIILCWLFVGIVIYLVGRLVLNGVLSLLKINDAIEWYEYFWVGFVAIIAILQIWSIFLPVNIYSLLFVVALSGVSLLFVLRKGIAVPKFDYKFLIYAAIILLAISYFASLPVGLEDTYLYHLNFVKWTNIYPVIPGLANLHNRFGLNSSLFVFASMIDNWIMKDRSSHIALSLMASVLSIQFLWVFLKSKERAIKIFSLLVLPLFSIGVVRTTLVASLSPDFALIMIVLVICLEILKEKKTPLFVAGLLSLLLVTIKFSGVTFAGLVLLFVIFRNGWKQTSITLFISGVLVLLPFLVRNVILSGWPFYPLPIFGVKAPWTLSRESVSGMYTVIRTWAISPGPDWNKSIGLTFWQWFPSWYSAHNWVVEMKMFFFGVFLSVLAPLMKMTTVDFFKRYKNLLFLGLAAFISAFYMLLAAPDFRFGQVFFWIFFGVVATCYIDLILDKIPNLKILFVFLGAYFIFTIMWPIRIDSEPIWRSVRWEPSFPVEKTLAKPSDGSSTFEVFVPTDHELCGNSDLPCTPYNNSQFKEIVPGDISKGFAPTN